MEARVAPILESFGSERSIAGLRWKHGMPQTTSYKWWDKSMEGGKEAIWHNGTGPTSSSVKAPKEELHRVTGPHTTKIQILCKT